MIAHTTDIVAVQRFRRDRGQRYCVSGHLRPGEYTAYYAASAEQADALEEKLRGRGCHQIAVDAPRPCDSGIELPADGTLADEHWCYCVGHCGYVVRYAPDCWRKYGQREMDRHIRTAHPSQWAQIQFNQRMSED